MSWDVVSRNFEHGYQQFNNGTYLPNYMLQYPKRPQTQHSLLGELQNILLKVKSIRQNFLEIGLAIKPQLPTGFFSVHNTRFKKHSSPYYNSISFYWWLLTRIARNFSVTLFFADLVPEARTLSLRSSGFTRHSPTLAPLCSTTCCTSSASLASCTCKSRHNHQHN